MMTNKDVSKILQENPSAEELGYGFFVNKSVSRIVFPQLGDISSFVFHGTAFSNVVFSEIAFLGADLSDAIFTNCCFSKGSLAGSIMYNTKFINCLFDHVDFSNARFSHSKVEKCVITESNFKGTIFSNANVFRTILSGRFDGLLNETKIEECIW